MVGMAITQKDVDCLLDESVRLTITGLAINRKMFRECGDSRENYARALTSAIKNLKYAGYDAAKFEKELEELNG